MLCEACEHIDGIWWRKFLCLPWWFPRWWRRFSKASLSLERSTFFIITVIISPTSFFRFLGCFYFMVCRFCICSDMHINAIIDDFSTHINLKIPVNQFDQWLMFKEGNKESFKDQISTLILFINGKIMDDDDGCSDSWQLWRWEYDNDFKSEIQL